MSAPDFSEEEGAKGGKGMDICFSINIIKRKNCVWAARERGGGEREKDIEIDRDR